MLQSFVLNDDLGGCATGFNYLPFGSMAQFHDDCDSADDSFGVLYASNLSEGHSGGSTSQLSDISPDSFNHKLINPSFESGETDYPLTQWMSSQDPACHMPFSWTPLD